MQRTAAVAVCGAAASWQNAQADESENLPIVDTHQHLWDLEKLPPRWLQGSPDILNRTYVTQDYLEATQGLNVVKAVYMEVGLAPDQLVAEAEQVINLCRSGAHPTVAAVISGTRHGGLSPLHRPLQGESVHQRGAQAAAGG